MIPQLRGFLKREWFGTRRNLGVLLVILILVPAGTAFGTAAYQQTIPEDIPIGIAPENESVSENELAVIKAGVTLYAAPIEYETERAARVALEREEVYLVLAVPPGLFETDGSVTLRMISDQRLVQFQEPANFTAGVLGTVLDTTVPADVRLHHERLGLAYSLSEFLIPTGLMIIVLLFGLLYVPLELYREREVFERVALNGTVKAATTAKIAAAGLLLVVPITVFQAVSMFLEYRLAHFSTDILGIIAITYLYAVCVGAGLMFWTRLRRAGVFLNFGILGAVLSMSSFIYPIGFFSAIRKQIATSLPTHHSMVILRSTMMKDAGVGEFPGRMREILLVTALAVLLLIVGIRRYRRSL